MSRQEDHGGATPVIQSFLVLNNVIMQSNHSSILLKVFSTDVINAAICKTDVFRKDIRKSIEHLKITIISRSPFQYKFQFEINNRM